MASPNGNSLVGVENVMLRFYNKLMLTPDMNVGVNYKCDLTS